MLLLTPELNPAFVSPGWPMFPVDYGAPRNLDGGGHLCVSPAPGLHTHAHGPTLLTCTHTHVLTRTHVHTC